ALAAFADELVSILEVVVAFKRFGNIVARIEGRAVQSLNQTNLILIDHRCVEETDVEQTRFGFITSFKRSGLRQDAIDARGHDVDLRTLLSARGDELFGILEIAMIGDRLAEQAARIEWIAVGGGDYADFTLRHQCRFRD